MVVGILTVVIVVVGLLDASAEVVALAIDPEEDSALAVALVFVSLVVSTEALELAEVTVPVTVI